MKYYLLALLCVLSVASADEHELFTFATDKQHERFDKFTKELRCLVCQNQTLADSQAPLAKDLRLEIAKQINEGKNDKEIIGYLTQRYGDFILYLPPFKKTTYFLWLFPVVALLIGCAILRSMVLSK